MSRHGNLLNLFEQCLTEASRRLARGEPGVVPVRSNDEVGELARAFNINARKMFGKRSALDQLLNAQRMAQRMQAGAPDGSESPSGQVAMTDGGPSGNPDTISTPMGEVAGSPGGMA